MSNEERPYIKVRNHIFYYDRSYAMHNGEVVGTVIKYNADGSMTHMTMEDFEKWANKKADYYDSLKRR